MTKSRARTVQFIDKRGRLTQETRREFHVIGGPRAYLALIMVISLIIAVVICIIMRIPPQEMSVYVAPLTGLTGIMIGYWFGRDATAPTIVKDQAPASEVDQP